MPGFLSWISGLLSPAASAKTSPDTAARRSRLLNPGPADSSAEQDVDRDILLEKLEEHLFCWLLDTVPPRLHAPSARATEVVREIQQRLEERTLEELPRQPLTLPTLMRALSSESVSRSDISRIILGDAALTGQVLQVANSPFFKVGGQTIESVDQAVFLMGLEGIRNLASASVMRPMLAARNSDEALFAQRTWRWGLTCARSAELIAATRGEDSTSHFMVGLLPALAHITLRREVLRIYRKRFPANLPDVQTFHGVLRQCHWQTTQVIAHEWNLPVRYHALLLTAERPVPGRENTSLNDGIILGTREILRDAHQRNLPDTELKSLVSLDDTQFERIRLVLGRMLKDGVS